jgi:UDP:flavonoid glycosyltransferase YjiC (YdhE family)
VRIALFAIPEPNHYRSLGTVVEALAGAGADVRVYGGAAYASEVAAAGATLVDVYGRLPVEAVDAESRPGSCRLVTWTAAHAGALTEEVAAFGPELVVGDGFAVAGRVVSSALGLPYVCVIVGHDMAPARVIPALADDPRVRLTPQVVAAAEVLRERHGWADASPFSYYHLSADLNLYCEPAGFLPEAHRAGFAPLAFWGSLPAAAAATPARTAARPPRRVYAAMGTIVWRYYPDQASAALRAVGDAARRRGLEAVISLGGGPLDDAAVAALAGPGVRVARWLDQVAELGEADAFVTHCGVHGVHEACLLGVPMIAYPCFGDQPGMAARARELGIAVPLADATLAPVEAADVEAALDRVTAERDAIDAALARAREWELEAIAARPAVVERIMALAR